MYDIQYIYNTYSEYLEGAKHLESFDELNELNENDKIYYVSKNKGPLKIGYFYKNIENSILIIKNPSTNRNRSIYAINFYIFYKNGEIGEKREKKDKIRDLLVELSNNNFNFDPFIKKNTKHDKIYKIDSSNKEKYVNKFIDINKYMNELNEN
jgi:hypothetical protein